MIGSVFVPNTWVDGGGYAWLARIVVVWCGCVLSFSCCSKLAFRSFPPQLLFVFLLFARVFVLSLSHSFVFCLFIFDSCHVVFLFVHSFVRSSNCLRISESSSAALLRNEPHNHYTMADPPASYGSSFPPLSLPFPAITFAALLEHLSQHQSPVWLACAHALPCFGYF